MRKKILILLVILNSCSTKTTKIKASSQVLSDSNVIAWYDLKTKDIWAISFPVFLSIDNENLISNEEFISHSYIYKTPKEGTFVYIFDYKNLKKEISNYERKEIKPKEKKEYLVYTKHLVNNSHYSNKILSVYKNIEFCNDSIPLGSFDRFKKKLPKLTQKLLLNDSVFLKFTNFDKKKSPPKRIKIPVTF